MEVKEHLGPTRLDPYGYHMLGLDARAHLDEWMANNNVIRARTSLLTYDARLKIVYVQAYEVDQSSGRIRVDTRKKLPVAAPIREITSAACPWLIDS